MISPNKLIRQEVSGCSAKCVDAHKLPLLPHNCQNGYKQTCYSEKSAAGQKQEHFCAIRLQIIMIQEGENRNAKESCASDCGHCQACDNQNLLKNPHGKLFSTAVVPVIRHLDKNRLKDKPI